MFSVKNLRLRKNFTIVLYSIYMKNKRDCVNTFLKDKLYYYYQNEKSKTIAGNDDTIMN